MTQTPEPAQKRSRTPTIVGGLISATALVLAIVASPLWLIIVVLFAMVNVARLTRVLGSSATNTVVSAFLITINLLIIALVALFYLSEQLGPL